MRGMSVDWLHGRMMRRRAVGGRRTLRVHSAAASAAAAADAGRTASAVSRRQVVVMRMQSRWRPGLLQMLRQMQSRSLLLLLRMMFLLIVLSLLLLLLLLRCLKRAVRDADAERVVAVLQEVVFLFLDGDATVVESVGHSIRQSAPDAFAGSVRHSVAWRFHHLLVLGTTILKPDFHLRG